MEAYLNKLPKEILIEIIKKQNAIENYATYKVCDELEQQCYKRKAILLNQIQEQVKKYCPKITYKCVEYRYANVDKSNNEITISSCCWEKIGIIFWYNFDQPNRKRVEIFFTFSRERSIDITDSFLETFPDLQDLYNYLTDEKTIDYYFCK